MRPIVRTLALALVATTPEARGDYHVDPASGSDAAGDGSVAAPWQTIGHALQQIVGEGHTLHLAAGDFDAASGESFPIVARPGVAVVGQPGGASRLLAAAGETIVSIESSSGCCGTPTIEFDGTTRFEDLRLVGGSVGVDVHATVGTPARPQLLRITCASQTWAGMRVGGTGALAEPDIRACRFEDCEAGLRMGDLNASSYVVVDDCEFVRCAWGVRYSADASDPFTFPTSLVRSSRFAGCGTAAYASAGEASPLLLLEECLIFGGTTGVAVASSLGFAQVRVDRCTITANERGLSAIGFAGRITGRNSIVWGNASDLHLAYRGAGEFDLEWCDVHDTAHGLPASNVDTDPLFAGAAFHLSPASPLIDAGDPAHPPGGVDVDVEPRVLDGDLDGLARVDMGADEYDPIRLDVTGSATPGGALTFAVTAPGGWAYVTFVSLGAADVPLGSLGSLLLDVLLLTPVASGLAPGADPVGLPSNPALSGLTLESQALGADLGSGAGSSSARVSTPVL